MSTTPSGRQPASVYRRRRITVAVIGLLLIGLLGWGVSAGLSALGVGNSDSENAQGNDPQDSTVMPSPSATAQPDGACDMTQIEVTATTDQSSYAAAKNPVLIMEIKNISQTECKLNVGTGEQEFLVMSGSDRIFSTADCAEKGEEVILDFKPGQQESSRFTWNRERSAPGCKPVNVQPRPGTYRFTATLGDIESEATSFALQ